MLFFIQSGALYSLFLGQLIRKDGEFHSSRLLDEKNMQARQNVQPKKKNRKSGLPTKLREKPQACVQICLQDCPASVPVYHIYTLPLVFVSWLTALFFCMCKVEIPEVNDDNSLGSQVQKNFICEHCYSAFRSSYHLKRHILTHTGTPRAFSALTSSCVSYKEMHWVNVCTSVCVLGEKPFGCDMCDMRFIQRYHLERHKRVHSGEKPYQCDRCQQVRRDKLRQLYSQRACYLLMFLW